LGTIKNPEGEVVENALLIGSFFGAIVDFLIIAFVIFLIVRALAKFQRKKAVEEAAPAAPDTQERLVNVLERLELKV
jgi:large conductance mechanosensitive channel